MRRDTPGGRKVPPNPRTLRANKNSNMPRPASPKKAYTNLPLKPGLHASYTSRRSLQPNTGSGSSLVNAHPPREALSGSGTRAKTSGLGGGGSGGGSICCRDCLLLALPFDHATESVLLPRPRTSCASSHDSSDQNLGIALLVYCVCLSYFITDNHLAIFDNRPCTHSRVGFHERSFGVFGCEKQEYMIY